MAGTFEKTSLDWQIRLLREQVGEWWERLFYRQGDEPQLQPQTPTLPPWVIETLFWLVVVALVGWAIWQLYKLLAPLFVRSIFGQGETIAPPTPPLPTLSVNEWLGRSRLAHQQGNYREACCCLYMAALQRLNETGLIRHLASRTDGEYLTLVQNLPRSASYDTLIRTHEQLCFSDVAVSAEAYERCQRAYRELEQP